MRARIAAGVVVCALSVCVVSGTAQAKGILRIVVSGPGLQHPLELDGTDNSPDFTFAANLANESGFYAQAIPDSSQPVETNQPAGDLGPRYELDYLAATDPGRAVRQDVYPFAAGGPVTYLAAGQTFDGRVARGGWFRAEDTLRSDLMSRGVPDYQPSQITTTPSAADIRPWIIAGAACVVGLLVMSMLARKSRRLAHHTA